MDDRQVTTAAQVRQGRVVRQPKPKIRNPRLADELRLMNLVRRPAR